MNKRLLLVTPFYVPARSYGGGVVACHGLVAALARRGWDVTVVTTNADGDCTTPAGIATRDGAHVIYCRRLFGLFAPGLLFQLARRIVRADVVYAGGVFSWFLPCVVVLSRLSGKRLVVIPLGVLSHAAMSGKRLKKRIWIALLRLTGLASYATVHAASSIEANDVQAAFGAVRIRVIPHGVDIAPLTEAESVPVPPYIAFLGRLEPIKRLESIITAVAKAFGGREEEASLRIAGLGPPDYVSKLQQLAIDLDISERVHFVGYVEGAEKHRLIGGASAVVLFSECESFGISVAESLAAGTPVIVSATVPWSEIETRKCGWIVRDPEQLSRAMIEAVRLEPATRTVMSTRAREWMQSAFTWDSIAAQFEAIV